MALLPPQKQCYSHLVSFLKSVYFINTCNCYLFHAYSCKRSAHITEICSTGFDVQYFIPNLMISSFIISLSSMLVFYKIGGHKIVGKYFILYKEHLMLSAGTHTGRGPKYFKIKKSVIHIYWWYPFLSCLWYFCHVYSIYCHVYSICTSRAPDNFQVQRVITSYFWKWWVFAYFLCTVVLSTSEKIAYILLYTFKIMFDTSVIQ